MAPLPAVDVNREIKFMEQEECKSLYRKLQSGIQCIKNGEVYTIEEAWEEIDRI